MFRRLIDIIFFLSVFPIFCPLIVIFSIINILILGSPIFFIQKRSGLKCKEISVIKFRTMKYFNQTEKSISKYGLFLRKVKIDELPQLLNLLKGDLTLIGPRPLYLEYNKLYSKKHKKRLLLKPGITGWAQINEFENISWKKKFDLDIWYYDNNNIFIDILILIKTFLKIFKSIFGKNQFSNKMKKFKGYN